VWWLVSAGAQEAAAALLRMGANINAVTGDGNSPLHLACFMNQLSTIEKLCELGASQVSGGRQLRAVGWVGGWVVASTARVAAACIDRSQGRLCALHWHGRDSRAGAAAWGSPEGEGEGEGEGKGGSLGGGRVGECATAAWRVRGQQALDNGTGQKPADLCITDAAREILKTLQVRLKRAHRCARRALQPCGAARQPCCAAAVCAACGRARMWMPRAQGFGGGGSATVNTK
jgi:ankyrin repeat protein